MYSNELKLLYEQFLLFPSNWKYSIIEESEENSWDKIENIDSILRNFDWLNDFSKLSISEIKIKYKLYKHDYMLISNILTLGNTQKYLTVWYLNLSNLNEALDILKLLSKWYNIQKVKLTYVSSEDIDNVDDKVTNAKLEFLKMIGIIPELKIELNSYL